MNSFKKNIILAHILITLIPTIIFIVSLDMSLFGFHIYWEVFLFFSGVIYFLFYAICENVYFYVLLSILTRILIIYLCIYLSLKCQKKKKLIFISHLVYSIITPFLGFVVMVAVKAM